MQGNYFEGNGVFNSLSNIFGNPTSGNTAEAKPVASSFITKVEGFMEKRLFGIPVWVFIVLIIIVGAVMWVM